MVGCKTFQDVLEILKKAKLELSDILQAVEFMDENAMKTTLRELNFTYPFNSSPNQLYPFYALIEVASNREGPENAERLYELLGSSEDLIIVC